MESPRPGSGDPPNAGMYPGYPQDMFMVMDDLGSLIWRFGKKLIVSSKDSDHGGDHHEKPPTKQPASPPAIETAAE